MTDEAIPLIETARRLGFGRDTFYRLEREGWLAKWGVVEVPRAPRGKRRFSAASVDRAIRGGLGFTLRARPAAQDHQ